jgi:Concanavalin A-like lectin/glucanases superfamily
LARSNNGTLINGPTFSSANAGSIVFDGSNDRVTLESSLDLRNLVTPLTITSWAFQNTTSFFRCLLAQYTTTSNHRLVKMLRVDTSTLIYYYGINTGGFSQVILSSPTVVLNRWNFFSVTVSGTPTNAIIKVGLNLNYSQPVTVTNLTTTPDTSVSINVGSTSNGSELWHGRIANTLMYNRALSDNELLQNYNATKGRFGLT